MLILVIVLAVLLAFAGGALAATLGAYRLAVASELQGRPILVTIPGNRPNTQITYAVRPSGWRRLTPKAHVQSKNRKGVARLRAMAAARAGRYADELAGGTS
jgi:hypothetical protein